MQIRMYPRIPPGHPEGYLEGFANIYNEAADRDHSRARDGTVALDHMLPTVQDGP